MDALGSTERGRKAKGAATIVTELMASPRPALADLGFIEATLADLIDFARLKHLDALAADLVGAKLSFGRHVARLHVQQARRAAMLWGQSTPSDDLEPHGAPAS